MQSPEERLAAEVSRARAVVLNSISNRKYHPTYGNTKTSLRREFDRFVSMGHAYAITFLNGGAADILNAQDACQHLGIDFDQLYRLVQLSLEDPYAPAIPQ